MPSCHSLSWSFYTSLLYSSSSATLVSYYCLSMALAIQVVTDLSGQFKVVSDPLGTCSFFHALLLPISINKKTYLIGIASDLISRAHLATMPELDPRPSRPGHFLRLIRVDCWDCARWSSIAVHLRSRQAIFIQAWHLLEHWTVHHVLNSGW
jgi:hypothetical protein